MAEGTLWQILCVSSDAQPQTFEGVKGADPPTLPPGSFLPGPVLWWGSLARLQTEKSDEVSRKGNWWVTEMGGGAGERLFTSSCLVGLVPLGLRISLVTCPLQCGIMWQLLLPTALLLLVSAGMRTEDLPKAVVFLEPQWYRVLEKDSVTLKCQGAYSPEDNSTQWFHNESLISSQASSYFIDAATVDDSGEYRCQTNLSTLSDPVQLEVHIGLAVSTISSFFPPGYQVSFCLVMVLLFAVDTGLYFSVKTNIRSSTRDWKDHKFKWRKDPQDK
ncbi:low affinity immunoglobulin gamma Fc region receptor III-A isoform e [Homo sapiens]|nr:low affinity immunoglobulin gamma Fc region receptor III-A isoform e [Homo sapiens]|eukprot:NP_001316051.1 low affinity immunoglobulin gamma Fc region receptor III-A isoform e [Homo sapiens]